MKRTLMILIVPFLFGCNDHLEEHVEYYPSGKIKEKTLIDKQKRAQGLAYEYYENGNLKFKRNNLNGKTNGVQEEYYPNGKLKAKGRFINNVEVDSTQFYNKQGKLERIVIYDKKGERSKEILYYPNGRIKEEIAILVGNGMFVSGIKYTELGKVIEDFSEGSLGYANLKYEKNSNGNLLLKIELKNNPFTDSVKLSVVKNFAFNFFTNPVVLRKITYAKTNKIDVEILDSDYVGGRLNILIEAFKYKDSERNNSLRKQYYIQLLKEGERPKNNVQGIYVK